MNNLTQFNEERDKEFIRKFENIYLGEMPLLEAKEDIKKFIKADRLALTTFLLEWIMEEIKKLEKEKWLNSKTTGFMELYAKLAKALQDSQPQ